MKMQNVPIKTHTKNIQDLKTNLIIKRRYYCIFSSRMKLLAFYTYFRPLFFYFLWAKKRDKTFGKTCICSYGVLTPTCKNKSWFLWAATDEVSQHENRFLIGLPFESRYLKCDLLSQTWAGEKLGLPVYWEKHVYLQEAASQTSSVNTDLNQHPSLSYWRCYLAPTIVKNSLWSFWKQDRLFLKRRHSKSWG